MGACCCVNAWRRAWQDGGKTEDFTQPLGAALGSRQDTRYGISTHFGLSAVRKSHYLLHANFFRIFSNLAASSILAPHYSTPQPRSRLVTVLINTILYSCPSSLGLHHSCTLHHPFPMHTIHIFVHKAPGERFQLPSQIVLWVHPPRDGKHNTRRRSRYCRFSSEKAGNCIDKRCIHVFSIT